MSGIPETTITNAHAERVACASVCAGGVETEYLRAGAGAPVVVLGDASDAWVGSLIAELSPHALVIVPRRPPGVAFATWLPGFLDGLGLAAVSVVAEAADAVHVRALANVGDGCIAHVVVVSRDTPVAVSRSTILQHGAHTDV